LILCECAGFSSLADVHAQVAFNGKLENRGSFIYIVLLFTISVLDAMSFTKDKARLTHSEAQYLADSLSLMLQFIFYGTFLLLLSAALQLYGMYQQIGALCAVKQPCLVL